MTPEDLYRYDVNGYLLLEGAIAPDELARLNARIDVWEERALEVFCAKSAGENQEVRYDDVVNQEESLVELAANPVVLPHSAKWSNGPGSSRRGSPPNGVVARPPCTRITHRRLPATSTTSMARYATTCSI